MKRMIKRILTYISIISLCLVFLLPIYGIVVISFKTMGEFVQSYWGLPAEWHFSNYIEVWNKIAYGGLKYFYFNTFKITIPAVIISILLSCFAAYSLVTLKPKGGNSIFLMLIFGLTIPAQILIIPIYKMLSLFYLFDTTIGMIWVHSAFGIPFCVFVLRNFMVSIPKEMNEAAILDGCSVMGVFWRIIMPLSIPALAVLIIFQFMGIYNDLFFSLNLTYSNNVAPITVAMARIATKFDIKWTLSATASIISSIPTIIVFVIFQKYFIKGIYMGAVK